MRLWLYSEMPSPKDGPLPFENVRIRGIPALHPSLVDDDTWGYEANATMAKVCQEKNDLLRLDETHLSKKQSLKQLVKQTDGGNIWERGPPILGKIDEGQWKGGLNRC